MKYSSIAFIILLLACNQTTNSSETRTSKYSRLLSKFQEISFDTLEVYSMGDGAEKNYKYNGVQLDSLDAILFPADIAKRHFSDPPGLFACYKFKIDSFKTGLITRTPSEYYPTSIKLFTPSFIRWRTVSTHRTLPLICLVRLFMMWALL